MHAHKCRKLSIGVIDSCIQKTKLRKNQRINNTTDKSDCNKTDNQTYQSQNIRLSGL